MRHYDFLFYKRMYKRQVFLFLKKENYLNFALCICIYICACVLFLNFEFHFAYFIALVFLYSLKINISYRRVEMN